jgi:hypothetical protein
MRMFSGSEGYSEPKPPTDEEIITAKNQIIYDLQCAIDVCEAFIKFNDLEDMFEEYIDGPFKGVS